ncbi:MAG: hypothetical protein ACLGIF_05345, partial [Actinomycetes bacterium]
AVAGDPTSPVTAAFARQSQFVVTPERAAVPAVAGRPVLILGRDIHRHTFAREAVDRLRDGHARVLVVDMGWPSEDRRYADVATFGASGLLGLALLAYLTHGPAPERPV